VEGLENKSLFSAGSRTVTVRVLAAYVDSACDVSCVSVLFRKANAVFQIFFV
jgi:hypothetical protein